MFSKLTQYMEKRTNKNKEQPVTKPVKGNFINVDSKTVNAKGGAYTDVTLLDKKGVEIPVLHVVNQDDELVATFAKSDHGPRYWFKAQQYASNATTPTEQLRVKEFDK